MADEIIENRLRSFGTDYLPFAATERTGKRSLFTCSPYQSSLKSERFKASQRPSVAGAINLHIFHHLILTAILP
eukprot:764006-Hanusia_phi.AAC.5